MQPYFDPTRRNMEEEKIRLQRAHTQRSKKGARAVPFLFTGDIYMGRSSKPQQEFVEFIFLFFCMHCYGSFLKMYICENKYISV